MAVADVGRDALEIASARLGRTLRALRDVLALHDPKSAAPPAHQATRTAAYALLAEFGVTLPGSYEDDRARAVEAWTARENGGTDARRDPGSHDGGTARAGLPVGGVEARPAGAVPVDDGRGAADRSDRPGAAHDEDAVSAAAEAPAVTVARRGGGR